MGTRPESEPNPGRTSRPPATTPESRENQLISLAVDLAERQLRDGTASSQTMAHYLKLASSREALEQRKLTRDIELLEAKSESLASQKRVEELYSSALKAMRQYAGHDDEDEYED